MEVENASQHDVLALLVGGEDVLTAPLGVTQSVVVTGFEYASVVEFRRARPDARGDVLVSSAHALCPTEGQRIVLFDQSFRVTAD